MESRHLGGGRKGGPRSVAAVVRWFQRLVKLFTIHCNLFVEKIGRTSRRNLSGIASALHN